MSTTVDPYKVLQVSPNFTLDELKNNYKRIAIKMYSDKGENEYMFNLVTNCFKHLMRVYKNRSSANVFDASGLKDAFKSYMANQAVQQNKSIGGANDKKFNLEKFNKFFDENRLEDVFDKGYDEWFRKGTVQEPPKFKGKTREDFNKHFETYASANDRVNLQEEPQALHVSKLDWTELGKPTIDDFTGKNATQKRLNFHDLKIAHSTSRIINPSIINRKEYQSVEELQMDREDIKYVMDPEEERKYRRRLQQQEDMEKKNREYLNARDKLLEKHYYNVISKMQSAI